MCIVCIVVCIRGLLNLWIRGVCAARLFAASEVSEKSRMLDFAAAVWNEVYWICKGNGAVWRIVADNCKTL